MLRFTNGTVVLPDRLLEGGEVRTQDDRIGHIGPAERTGPLGFTIVDLNGGYLLPGFIDLHVHGGDGADFMDGTAGPVPPPPGAPPPPPPTRLAPPPHRARD